MPAERLDKLISSSGKYTRSESSKLIRSGAVCVNGVSVKNPASKADGNADVITINSQRFIYKKHIYIMMNKPEGVISASDSPNDRTVIDLLPDELKRPGLFPAGRLDRDTTGFMLITDDGDFAHRILSPKRHVSKTYRVTLREDITEDEAEMIRTGLMLNGEKLLPAKVKKLDGEHVYEVVLKEGRYHQIKRMFARLSNEVVALERTAMGNLTLDTALKRGDAREMTAEEITQVEMKT